ncbi:MAG: glycosyltransferase family 4 protein [Bifidobacteriaceae bacterium]|nr:glycosyltransferase family 4 protein [Bifidobacteriaceae bacterium]
MRVGIVCPYSFDVVGGVQLHVRDLAEELIGLGHDVSVLAPAETDTPVPPYVVTAGRSVPIHWNGSVARLSFGPRMAARTRRWLADGHFDVVHIHEPVAPSLGLLALWLASGPIVATFHSNPVHSRALRMSFPLVRAPMEKITAAIAVSEDARRTLIDHYGGDAVIVPNGVHVAPFRDAEPKPEWRGTPERPVVAFLGRADEPRKGLAVLLGALPELRRRVPGVRLLVAGPGEVDLQDVPAADRGAVEPLGAVSDEDKASLFKGADLYVAPQTGGESFGIVLIEAMSAGCPVLASDLGAFARVLDAGSLGSLFPVGDSAALAAAAADMVAAPAGPRAVADRAAVAVERYDWSEVAQRVLAVYETAVGGEEVGVADH